MDAAERDMSLRPFNKPKYLATLNTLYSLSGVSPPILHITVDMTNMLEKNHRDFFHYIRAFKRDSLGILVSWIRQEQTKVRYMQYSVGLRQWMLVDEICCCALQQA